MKILQICNKIPFPPKDGGSIAMNMLTQGLLQAGHNVQVLAMNTPKQLIREDEIDADYRTKTKFQSGFIDTSVKVLPAFFNLFSNESYNISRFYSKEFECILIKLLKEETFDMIQLESLWVTPYLDCIRLHSKAKVVYRSHNVEYLIWERLALTSANPIKRAYLNMLSKRLKKYELSILNKLDGIVSITENDKAHYENLGSTSPSIHIPFGINVEKYKMDATQLRFPSVFHIGAMDWMPNVDAVKWILDKIWLDVLKKCPDLKLYLAGRNMPAWMKETQLKNVMIEGEVKDAQSFMNSKSIMIVPLTSGGGMRVKIIEGMALGKTIISTAIGAEGIEYENNKNILIANTAQEFVAAITKCSNDKLFSDQIGKEARILIEEKYNNRLLCEKLTDFYKTLIQQ